MKLRTSADAKSATWSPSSTAFGIGPMARVEVTSSAWNLPSRAARSNHLATASARWRGSAQ